MVETGEQVERRIRRIVLVGRRFFSVDFREMATVSPLYSGNQRNPGTAQVKKIE
jgi:hypothetical protein